MEIIKVQYYVGTTLITSPREYTYYSEDKLKVGDIVIVPVRDTTGKAKVSAVDVPETEIEAFKDRVKIIPAGSLATEVKSVLPAGGLAEAARAAGAEVNVTTVDFTPVATTAVVNISPGTDITVLSLRDQVVGLLKYAESRLIATDDDVKRATEDLSLISTLKKTIEGKKKEYVGPLNDHLKTINEVFKLLTEPLAQADGTTRQKILAYRHLQEQKRLEAEEINRQKEELAQREAKFNGTGEITVDTTPVPVPSAPPAHVRTEVGTMGTMKVRKWEVEDLGKVPIEYLMIDGAKVTKLVKAGIGAIPGIRIFEEETLRINSK